MKAEEKLQMLEKDMREFRDLLEGAKETLDEIEIDLVEAEGTLEELKEEMGDGDE